IFKRLIPILIGLGIIILLFLLSTKVILPKIQKTKTPTIITLKYWGLWEPENIMAEIISDYQQTHPNVTVQYISQSSKDYRERLQSSLAKGDGPDIFRWHNTWLPMLKTDLAPIPDTIYSSNEFDTTFYPIVKKDAFFNGHYFGIPLMFDTLALYVNEDIFQSDSTLKIPTTWDNLRQTAYKLTVRDEQGNPTRAGIALGTATNVDNFSDILGLMILQNAGNPGKSDSDAVTSAIKFYTLFSSQDRTWNDQLPNSTYAFATAKAVMMIAPSWRALEVKAINSQLNFKLYPVPQLPGTNISWATYWLEGVSKKSVNTDAAWEFIKYLSSREVLTKMYNLAVKTRLFGEPYPRQDMANLLQADPFLGAVLSQALSAQSWPLSSRTFDNGLNDKIIKYYEDAINSYLKNMPESEITQNLTQGVTQVLSQYGLAN
ncbi:MAG: extracellular solute-binding protein, partial [Patescibacteria group bacterium]|nr:extracellular solute-binding protein [Patescibacteria group bacterium]